MKVTRNIKLSVLISVIMIFLTGCGDVSEYSNPVGSNNIDGINWISMPLHEQQTPDGISLQKIYFTVSKNINGKDGGKLELKNEYPGGPFGKVKVELKLEFKDKSFEGERLISMTVQPEFGSAVFQPHGTFAKPAEYDAKFEGLDLRGIDPKKVRFVYMAEDGTYEFIPFDKIKVDIGKGILKVEEAQLPHFSRFGFVN
ncbi:MAG: hypothetical protein FJ213_07060 [Ignavibacteria bacterium]|nr:hypothetical protein [Ignavibacteria bacterium]